MSNTPIPSFAETITVTRATSADTTAMGRPVAGTTTTVSVLASVQRMKPEDTQQLPEAYRTSQSYRIYSEMPLFTLNEATGFAADRITIDGERYFILFREYWRYVMPHWKCIAVRDERNAK